MAEYVAVGPVEEIPPGEGRTVTIADKEVALFNVDGSIYAIADACLHQGMSLGSSMVEGKIVTCRGHGWKYDVTTGSTLASPGYGVAAYAVKVVDGQIMVATDETVNFAT